MRFILHSEIVVSNGREEGPFFLELEGEERSPSVLRGLQQPALSRETGPVGCVWRDASGGVGSQGMQADKSQVFVRHAGGPGGPRCSSSLQASGHEAQEEPVFQLEPKGRRKLTSQLRASVQEKSSLTCPTQGGPPCSTQAFSRLEGAPQPRGGPSAFLDPLLQTLISSENTQSNV